MNPRRKNIWKENTKFIMHLSKWVVHKPVSYLNAVTAWREVDDVKLWEKYATKEAVRGSENRDAVDGC